MAVQIVWKKLCNAVRSGVRKATIAFQISWIFVLIASIAMPIKI